VGKKKAYGGSTAAFRDTPLQEWIRAQNKDGKILFKKKNDFNFKEDEKKVQILQ